MRSTAILLTSLVAVLSNRCLAASDLNVSSFDDYDPIRVCPEGFDYAGEDTKLLGSYWSEEIYRSPVYSCYKILHPTSSGFNEALNACDELKADLVTFEDAEEVRRVTSHVILKDDVAELEEDLLTSAMFFSDVEKWIWLGSNQTEVTFNITGKDNKKQCLTFGHVNATSDPSEMTFKAVECNQPIRAMCEARVQTVTYLAWFYSNWLSFLLVLLTILLLSALCISVFRYSSGRRMYRHGGGRRGGCGQNRQARVSVSSLPYIDAPPTYNDVTGGGNTATAAATPETTMGKYKNKGKDILAKVTLYKSGTNAANAN